MTRSEFLKDRIDNCKRHLAEDNRRYPNGRMSHEVELECLAEAEAELFDLMIDGEFDAHGRFVRFAEEV
jgi:hypothetical protein